MHLQQRLLNAVLVRQARQVLTVRHCSLTVIVGTAGAGVSGAAGGAGGATSFGGLATAPGGLAGTAVASTVATLQIPAAAPVAGTGGYLNARGNPGSATIMLTISSGGIGKGGVSQLGSLSYGSGGDGTVNTPSAAAQVGQSGATGVVIIEEYS